MFCKRISVESASWIWERRSENIKINEFFWITFQSSNKENLNGRSISLEVFFQAYIKDFEEMIEECLEVSLIKHEPENKIFQFGHMLMM
jgi:hypothetical protein